jgi:hypothetical protein
LLLAPQLSINRCICSRRSNLRRVGAPARSYWHPLLGRFVLVESRRWAESRLVTRQRRWADASPGAMCDVRGRFDAAAAMPCLLGCGAAGLSLPLGPYGILCLILLMYIVLGAIMDELAMILLTIPVIYPVIVKLGFDPIWFGVIVVMVVELGMIMPPIGINVFVINSLARDVPLWTIYKGVMPFILSDLVRLTLLVAFPILSTLLPSWM